MRLVNDSVVGNQRKVILSLLSLFFPFELTMKKENSFYDSGPDVFCAHRIEKSKIAVLFFLPFSMAQARLC